MSTHTPGPWLLDGTYVYQDDATGRTICDCAHSKTRDRAEQVSNAKLIAAAPELLEALRDAHNLIVIARNYFPKSIHNHDKFNLENTCAAIGKAIAKATGELEVRGER